MDATDKTSNRASPKVVRASCAFSSSIFDEQLCFEFEGKQDPRGKGNMTEQNLMVFLVNNTGPTTCSYHLQVRR